MKRKALILAIILLGLAQCKKELPLEPQGEQVRITLNVDNGASTGSTSDGSRVIVNPNSSPMVTFESGDKILVGYNGAYVGTITHDGTCFTGDITITQSGDQPLYFYFLGNKDAKTSSNENIEAGATHVDISDQSGTLPVISMAPSNEDYSSTVTSYSASLHNQCSIIKFNVTTSSTSDIYLKGLDNQATVDFSNHTKGFYTYYPGILVPEGCTLTIQGEAEGTGTLYAGSWGNASGIGPYTDDKYGTSRCGNIVINGGVVTSTGGYKCAGIGGGLFGNCGSITINGGDTYLATSPFVYPNLPLKKQNQS